MINPVLITNNLREKLEKQLLKSHQNRRFDVSLNAALLVMLIGIIGLYFVLVELLWNIETEDSYIVCRYAYNLVEEGRLVYNIQDQTNSLTSPLHALLLSAIYWIFQGIVLPNKILGLTCFLGTVAFLIYFFRKDNLATVTALVIVLISPFAVLWSLGGLETALLMFLTTILTLLIYDSYNRKTLNTGRCVLVFVVAGLAFLTRHDSILFTAPAIVAFSLRHTLKKNCIAAALGGLAPLVWLIFARFYYGDFLPNSFWVKGPDGGSLSLSRLTQNGAYSYEFFIFSGIALLLAACFIIFTLFPHTLRLIKEHIKQLWWIYAGMSLTLAYALLTATTHMFYAFRLFVPYLPALAILVIDLILRLHRNESFYRRRIDTILAGFIGFVLILQVANMVQLRVANMSGARNGEFRSTTVKQMTEFVKLYQQPADIINQHWRKQKAGRTRAPRIFTFAAGILPYQLKEAYIYEVLSAYRHNKKSTQHDLMRASDYICILTPRHGSIEDQLPPPAHRYIKLVELSGRLDGRDEKYIIFYNPSPQSHSLPEKVNGQGVGEL